MQCPKCNLENPPEARFCIACGQGLGRVCPRELRERLEQSKEMDKDTQEQLMQALDEFKTTFTA